MMIVTFTPCSKRAFSNVLEGVAIKNFLWASPQTPIFFSCLFHTYSCFVLCNGGPACLPAFILRGVTDFRKSVNSSGALPYTRDNNNLVSMSSFIVGIDYVVSSIYYYCNCILSNLSSLYACSFRRAISSVVGAETSDIAQ